MTSTLSKESENTIYLPWVSYCFIASKFILALASSRTTVGRTISYYPKFVGLNPATVKMTQKKAYCVDLAISGNTVTNNSCQLQTLAH
jgi:hypothetical protein